MLLYLDLAKAKKHMGADPGQLSLFGGGAPGQPVTPTAAAKHLEPVQVKGHTRHTDHGSVEVGPHTRLVMKVDRVSLGLHKLGGELEPRRGPSGHVSSAEIRAPERHPHPTEEVYRAARRLQLADREVVAARALLKHDADRGAPEALIAAGERKLSQAREASAEANRLYWDETTRAGLNDVLAMRIMTDPDRGAPTPVTSVDLSRATRVEPFQARDQDTLRHVFGRDMTEGEVVALIGVTAEDLDEADISCWTEGGADVYVETTTPEFHSLRSFSRRDGQLEANNSSLDVTSKGNGLGAQLLGRQVDRLVAAGATRITTFAAGDPKSGTAMIGYKVWPKLGFDGPLPERIRRKVIAAGLPPAERVSDLLRTPEGWKAWENEIGGSIDVAFDLSEHSISRRVLRRYLAKKEADRARPRSRRRPEED